MPETPRVGPPKSPRGLVRKENYTPDKGKIAVLVGGSADNEFSRHADWWKEDGERKGAAALIR